MIPAARSRLRAQRFVGMLGVATALLMSGCPSTPPPPTPPPPSGISITCPIIPATAVTGCPGLSLAAMTLRCSAAPTAGFLPGSNRARVILGNGSTISGTTTVAVPTISIPVTCARPGPALPFTLTFGVDYTGAPSATTPVCIRASKAAFTQFVLTGTPTDALLSAVLLDRVQLALDAGLLAVFNTTPPAAGASPRCGNWQTLP